PCRSRLLQSPHLPPDSGVVLMDAVQTLTNALVVAAVGAVLAWMLTGFRRELREDLRQLRGDLAAQGAELRGEMAAQGAELRGEMAQLHTSLRGEIAELRAEMREEIRALRSDLTQVALAVGVRPRAQNQ